MKLDVNCMRYLTKDDYRVLTAVEMGMRNHEMVPVSLITSIAKLRHGGSYKILSTLLRHKLVAHTNTDYNGYRLSYMGYDILALRSLLSRGTIASVGPQIGVGKESDIFEAQTEDGEEVVIKIHRLGRTSFRAVRRNRDYMQGKSKASWLFMSRLAALKEYSFMKALYAHGFPTPVPIDQSRHIVVMSRVSGSPMCQIKTGNMYGAEKIFEICMNLLKRLAEHGLIHCDFNEFNLMLDELGNVTLIDFPQMVSTSHCNGEELFARDVNGLVKFFGMKMRYYPSEDAIVKLSDIVKSDIHIDEEVKASGFTQEEDDALMGYILQQPVGDEGENGEGDEDQDDDEDEEGNAYDAPEAAAEHVFTGGNRFGVLDKRNLKDCLEPQLPATEGVAEAEEVEEEERNRQLVAKLTGGAAAGDAGSDSGLSDLDDENAEDEGEGEGGPQDKVKGVQDKLRKDAYRKAKSTGSGKVSRNATKKRNKYGKIDKGGGVKSLMAEW
jgi:RIO kinase 2